MNFMNFLAYGVEGNVSQYRRDTYRGDSSIKQIGRIEKFLGTKKIAINNEVKTITVDGAYRFSLISDKITNECSAVWIGLRSYSKRTFCVSLVGGICCLFTAIMAKSVPAALTKGGISLALFAFSYFVNRRANQADAQLKKWADPIDDYIAECRRMHLEQTVAETQQFVNTTQENKISDLRGEVEKLVQKIRDNNPENTPRSSGSPQENGPLQKTIKHIENFEKQIAEETDQEKLLKLKESLEFYKKMRSKHESNQLRSVQSSYEFSKSTREADCKSATNTLINFIKLQIILHLSKEDAQELLRPYFEEFPQLQDALN